MNLRRRVAAQRILYAYREGNDVSSAAAEGVLGLIEEALDRLPDASVGASQRSEAGEEDNPFPGWLARNRLTVQEAAQVLGASTGGVQSWKLDRPPKYVLLACAAWSGGCEALPALYEDDNPFPRWMESRGLSIRQAANSLGTSTSSIDNWKCRKPRPYVLLACAALSEGRTAIS